jgi:hypothetical protein
MTRKMRFLVEDFAAVPEEVSPEAARRFQWRSARMLLPGTGLKGAPSVQQVELVSLPVERFQYLRRWVRGYLRTIATKSPIEGHRVKLEGPLEFWLHPSLRMPLVEGDPSDVFLFYLVQLASRVGVSQIGVCRAPKAKSQEPCGVLFLRRGKAKKYCSEQCRARVATRRARA